MKKQKCVIWICTYMGTLMCYSYLVNDGRGDKKVINRKSVSQKENLNLKIIKTV